MLIMLAFGCVGRALPVDELVVVAIDMAAACKPSVGSTCLLGPCPPMDLGCVP